MDPYQSAWAGTVLLQHLCCHPDLMLTIIEWKIAAISTGTLLNQRGVAQCRCNQTMVKKDFRMKQNPLLQWRQFDYNNVYTGAVCCTYSLSLRKRYRLEYFLFSFAGERWRSKLSTSAHFVNFQRGRVEFNLICLEHALKSPWNWWAKLRSLRRSGRMFRMSQVLWEIWRCQYFCLWHFVTVVIVWICEILLWLIGMFLLWDGAFWEAWNYDKSVFPPLTIACRWVMSKAYPNSSLWL